MTAIDRTNNTIVYRATVCAISFVDIALEVVPAVDGETPIEPTDGFGRITINVPGAANGDDVGDTLRAFGALIGIKGAVRLIIDLVP